SNESDAGFFAGARKRRVFRKKAITWVNSVDALLLRHRDDSCNVQVGFDRTLASANLIGLVSFEAVQRQPIFLRIDGHGAQAELRSANCSPPIAAKSPYISFAPPMTSA